MADTPRPSKATLELARRLNSATRHLARAVRERMSGDIAQEYLDALNALVFAGPVAIGELARREGVSAPAMTKAVGVLEARRLVTRTRNAADGRVVVVSPTLAGKRLILRGRDTRVARIATALELLHEARRRDIASAVDALDELVRNLEPHEAS